MTRVRPSAQTERRPFSWESVSSRLAAAPGAPLRRSLAGGLQLFRRGLLTLMLATALAPLALRAQIPTPAPPERLSYQGYLVDANGNPLGQPNPKNYDVIFRIWDDQSATDPSHMLWSEQQTITVDKGYFSVLLGEGSQFSTEPHPDISTLFDGPTASDRFVEVTVKGIGSGGSDVTILPRLRLLTSPYAFLAQKALNATTLVNGTNATIVNVDGTALNVNGSVSANSFSGNGGALTALNGANLNNGSVGTAEIASGAVTTPKIADGAVSSAKLASSIGIGTTAPAAKLQVSGGAIMPAVGNSSSAGIEFPKNPGGGSGDEAYLRYYVRSAPESTTLELGIHNDGDDNIALMASGHVGINTLTPTHGTLEIHATKSTSVSGYGYIGGSPYSIVTLSGTRTFADGYISGSSGGFACGVYSDGRLVAPEVDAFSDARLKHVEGVSNGRQDLRTLMGIQITDYRMVDTVADGARQYKKVIAQQVEKVYPQAVSRTAGTVPDIYTRTEAKAGWIHLTKPLTPALKVGDQVKLITAKGSALHKVLEVNADGFRVKEPLNGSVFVYGREVKDLRVVDYDAISMLNVSATQQLYRQLQAKDAEIQRLRDQVQALAARQTEQTALYEKLAAEVARIQPPIQSASLH